MKQSIKLLTNLVDALGCAEPSILMGYQHHLTKIKDMEEPYRTDFITSITKELNTKKNKK
jgi:hypothetical protein